jgi:hypothetical protein
MNSQAQLGKRAFNVAFVNHEPLSSQFEPSERKKANDQNQHHRQSHSHHSEQNGNFAQPNDIQI